MPVKHFTGKIDGKQKQATQREFKNNDFALLVATKAFGMGIDKPNIRYTVHYNIPPSLEAFYQEAGRAGRDRQLATCWLLFSNDAAEEVDRALSPDAPEDVVAKIADKRGGDIHRLLWLHRNSFRGLTPEVNTIKEVYKHYLWPALTGQPTGMAVDLAVPFHNNQDDPNNEQMQMQRDKALYRLATLGTVQDYTLDYSKKVFDVTAVALHDDQLICNLQDYVRRYKTREVVEAVPMRVRSISEQQTVLGKCAVYLLQFVYDEIEKKRRAAMRSMVEVARKAASLQDHHLQDVYVRNELTAYLEKSPFTDVLLALARTINSAEWLEVLQMRDDNGVRLLSTVDGVRQLIGGCRRTLESYLDHPGLLYLSSVGRLLLPDPDIEQAMNEVSRAFLGLAVQSSQQRQYTIIEMLHGYQSMLRDVANGGDLYRRVASVALEGNRTRILARELFPVIPRESKQVIYNCVVTDIRSLNMRLQQQE